MEFVASIVGSLAWPATALFVLWVLRKPLAQLIPLLQRLRYRDIELDFSKKLEEAREVTTMLESPGRRALSTEQSTAVQLALVSPRAGVHEGWRTLESAILTAAHSLGESFFQDRKPLVVSAITVLEKSGVINRDFGDVLEGLRELRNEASHAPDFAVPVSEALDFIRTCEQLARILLDRADEAKQVQEPDALQR
ncbi:MAG: hypothetical protein M1617_04180 [Actinobacteria bacterium]|nr:hypothetical protein [Actinomycetota bacterium]MCL5887489.1 hypothetical protein [Actinomycetota bacterium]